VESFGSSPFFVTQGSRLASLPRSQEQEQEHSRLASLPRSQEQDQEQEQEQEPGMKYVPYYYHHYPVKQSKAEQSRAELNTSRARE